MKKILPTTLLLICLITMLCFSIFFPIKKILTFPISLLGLLPLAAGLALSVLGSNKFEEVGTNIKTFADPDVVVTEGLYRFSRNPMYLGFVFVLFGVAILFGKLSPFVVVVTFFLIADRWYIIFEERAMDRKFGETYQNYKIQTRRWL